MVMVKVKTAELNGQALNWAVAWAVADKTDGDDVFGGISNVNDFVVDEHFKPSTDWSQCGPLMEKYEISVIMEEGMGPSSFWAGTKPVPDSMFGFNYKGASESGETILIAVCRAIVAAELGDEVEVPQELVTVEQEEPEAPKVVDPALRKCHSETCWHCHGTGINDDGFICTTNDQIPF